MKSQDIGLLLKLLAVEISEKRSITDSPNWSDWDVDTVDTNASAATQLREDGQQYDYTARGLEMETGISKTQINLSLRRSMEVGLLFRDRDNGAHRVNALALFEFITYAIRYVFPARRGVQTASILRVIGEHRLWRRCCKPPPPMKTKRLLPC